MDTQRIKEVYGQYPYTFEKSGDEYLIFSYEEGIYPAVDIVVSPNVSEETFDKLHKDYSQSGYATRRINFVSIEALEDTLFENFFTPSAAKDKLKSEYGNYIKKIMEPYASVGNRTPTYRYVEVSYKEEHNFKKSTNVHTRIVEELHSLLNRRGATLMVVEAPAGFGKTSTAYELIQRLSEDDNLTRPFFMRLEKDRQATTFWYLLLSQIDRNFKVKHKNKLVLSQIKKGRIPLVIDGFDELLSQDMDQGKDSNNFEKVETMLSTIGDLLTDETKIVLTTRKTAIFSGDKFMDWYYDQLDKGRDFSLFRIQLEDPNISDWLTTEQIQKLPKSLLKVTNPVLLSYLRYVDSDEFDKLSDSWNLINSYFEFIFKREQERQDIPFSSSDQYEIFEGLATYFAVFDVTSVTRPDVSSTIAESNQELIEGYSTSPDKAKSLVNKLTNHAILDRHENGNIGFVNDFIFGTLLAKALTNSKLWQHERIEVSLLTSLSISTADKLIEAATLWGSDLQKDLAAAVLSLENLSPAVIFATDRYLIKEIEHKFEGLTFDEDLFENLKVDKSGMISNCTFTCCEFKNCSLNFDFIKDSYFINCRFIDSEESGDKSSCSFYDSEAEDSQELMPEAALEKLINESDILDTSILKHFYRKGSMNTRVNRISSIIDNLGQGFGKKAVTKRLEWFNSKRFIHTQGDMAWILKDGSDYYNTLTPNT